MAEPTVSSGPSLPSTADAVPYVAVSWLAVAAAGAAAALLLSMIALGIVDYFAHKPLLELELFAALAITAILLSFAARRVIRNSEGTRTGTLFGINLPSAAWWTGVVLGLGYIAYMFAIEYSIRKDAQFEVQAWLDNIQKGDAESLNRAFHRTQEAAVRRTVRPDDGAGMEARWRDNYVAFHQCDIVLSTQRNPGSTFELGGLRDWTFTPAGVECVFTATLTNAEGIFPLRIPLRAAEQRGSAADAGGRQWQIVFTASGFIQPDESKITPYGWQVMPIVANGGEFGRKFIATCSRRENRPDAILDYTDADPQMKAFLQSHRTSIHSARLAGMGGAAASVASSRREAYDAIADRFSTLPNGAAPDARQKQLFRDIWNGTGFNRIGERIRDNPDQHDRISFTDSRLELRVPVEVPLPSVESEVRLARGRILLVCSDPAILAELKSLRESSSPDQATTTRPEGLRIMSVPWKVVRLESDLKSIPVPPRQRNTMPGG